jgi:hypothetical protein
MDSFSEVTNHLIRLENNHMKKVPFGTGTTSYWNPVLNIFEKRVVGLLLTWPNRVKQSTVQVYLNGQLLVQGVDWNEGANYNDGSNPGYTVPGVGEAVHAISFNFEGELSDTYSVYAVPFEETIDYGGSGSGSGSGYGYGYGYGYINI